MRKSGSGDLNNDKTLQGINNLTGSVNTLVNQLISKTAKEVERTAKEATADSLVTGFGEGIENAANTLKKHKPELDLGKTIEVIEGDLGSNITEVLSNATADAVKDVKKKKKEKIKASDVIDTDLSKSEIDKLERQYSSLTNTLFDALDKRKVDPNFAGTQGGDKEAKALLKTYEELEKVVLRLGTEIPEELQQFAVDLNIAVKPLERGRSRDEDVDGFLDNITLRSKAARQELQAAREEAEKFVKNGDYASAIKEFWHVTKDANGKEQGYGFINEYEGTKDEEIQKLLQDAQVYLEELQQAKKAQEEEQEAIRQKEEAIREAQKAQEEYLESIEKTKEVSQNAGWFRNQTNLMTDDSKSWNVAFSKIYDERQREWVDKNGVDQFSSTPLINYDKLLKEILKTDKEIFNTEQQIKNAKGSDTSAIQANLDAAKQQLDIYEQIMYQLASKDEYIFGEEQIEIIQKLRKEQEDKLKNSQAFKESEKQAVEQAKEQAKVQDEIKKNEEKAGQELTKLLKLEEQILDLQNKISNSTKDTSGDERQLLQLQQRKAELLTSFYQKASGEQTSKYFAGLTDIQEVKQAYQQQEKANKVLAEAEKQAAQAAKEAEKQKQEAIKATNKAIDEQAKREEELYNLMSRLQTLQNTANTKGIRNQVISSQGSEQTIGWNLRNMEEMLKDPTSSISALKVLMSDLEKSINGVANASEQTAKRQEKSSKEAKDAYKEQLKIIDELQQRLNAQSSRGEKTNLLSGRSNLDLVREKYGQQLSDLQNLMQSVGPHYYYTPKHKEMLESLANEIDAYIKKLSDWDDAIAENIEWQNRLDIQSAKGQQAYERLGLQASSYVEKIKRVLKEIEETPGLSEFKNEAENLKYAFENPDIEFAEFATLKEQFRLLEERIKSTKAGIESFAKATDLSSIQKGLDDLSNKGLSKLVQEDFDALKVKVANVNKEIQNLNGGNVPESTKLKIQSLAEELEKVKSQAIETEKELKKLASDVNIDAVANRMQSWLSSNKKLSDETKNSVEQLMKALQPGVTTKGELADIAKQFSNIQLRAKAAGETGKTFFDIWKQGATAVARYITTFTSFYRIVGYIREAFTTIKDLDYALVDLRKTAHMTSEEFESFYFNANDVAKQMGVTTQEIIEQASAWSRLGYNTAEAASQMAALSSQFASISPGMSTDTAQTGLVSIMKAWDVDVEKVKRDIMDNINTLGNNFALTNEDIIQGMERAGATLSAIGMDIQGSFALFTGAQEVIQNAETVGTALKTLSLRIRGYDEETEQLSDDVVAATGKVADLTKVASNNFAGVSLWADAAQTEYRSLVDYLGDIADIWDEIDAKSRTSLLEKLFGKRGASVGSAIIQNFDQVEDALVAMEEAAGSSDREMEIVQQSITYKLNQLKETWTGIFQDLIDRGDVGKLIDSLIKLSEAFANPIENLTAFGAALGGIFTIGMKGGGIFQKDFLVGITDKFKNATRVINEYNEAVKPGVWHNYAETQKQVKQSLDGASDEMTRYITGLKLGTATMQGYTASIIKNTIASVAAKAATIALNTAINIGFAMAVSFAIKKITELIQREDKLIEAAQKSAKALEEQTNSLRDQVDKYNELERKLKDSNLSESEIYDIKEQLYEIQKSLNDEYGTEADRLDLVNGKYEDQLSILQSLSKEKAHQYIQDNQEAYEEALKRVSKRTTLDFFGGPMLIDNPENEDRDAWKKYAENIQKGIEEYVSIDQVNGQITLDVEAGEAEDVLRQLYDNIKKWGEDTGDNVSETLLAISNDINKFGEDNEKLTAAKATIQAYQKAQVIDSDILRSIYNDAIEAVEEYNKALATGKGIEEAKQNLEIIRQQFVDNKDEVEGAEQVFQDVFDQINTFAEDKHEIDVFFNVQTNENGEKIFDPSQVEFDENVQRYLDVLGNYTDFELKGLGVDFNAKETKGAEAALIGLAEAIGVGEENIDALIDKLVELGYVEGKIKETTEEVADSFEFSDIATSVENVNKRLKSQFDALGEAYQKIFYGDNNEGFSLDRVDTEMMENLRTTFLQIDKDLEESGVVFDVAPINEFLDVITSAETKSKSLAEQQQITQDAVNELATKYFYAAEGLKDLNAETKDALEQQFKKMGITNAEEIVDQIQFMQESIESLNDITLDDIDFSKPIKDLENELQRIKELQGSGIGDSYKEAEEQLEVYNNLKEKLAEGSLTVENATAAEIAILVQEGAVSEETGQAIALLKMQKILVNENALNETESINELIHLAGVAGVATDALIELASIQAQIDRANAELEVAIKEGNAGRISTVQDIIGQLQVKAANAKAKFEEDIANTITSVQYENPQTNKNAKSGGSSAGKSYVDGFKEELSKLKESYERGKYFATVA